MEHVLLVDMAIHTFDMARWISGTDPVDVSCMEWNPAHSWFAHGAAAVATFRMTDNVVYSYRGAWCAEGCPTAWEGSWRLVCEKGTIVWDGGTEPGAPVTGERVSGTGGFLRPVERVAIPVPDLPRVGHGGCIEEFVSCVKRGGRPATSVDDAVRSLAMVFAAIEASKTGTTVPVEQVLAGRRSARDRKNQNPA